MDIARVSSMLGLWTIHHDNAVDDVGLLGSDLNTALCWVVIKEFYEVVVILWLSIQSDGVSAFHDFETD